MLYTIYITYILLLYILSTFSRCPNTGEKRVKIWHETVYFSYLMKCSEQKSKGKGAHKFLIFKHFCNNLGAINYLGTRYTFKNFRVFQ